MADPTGGWRPADSAASPGTELPRLAARMDAELRADREEEERMAVVARLRARNLADVARDLLVRGDEIAVHLPGTSLSSGGLGGTVVHAGGDLAVVQTIATRLDLRLGSAALVRVVRAVRVGGAPPGRGARSFLARLREHELSGTRLTAYVEGAPGSIDGVLEAVAADHVLLAGGGGTWVLPLARLAAVGYASGPDGRR